MSIEEEIVLMSQQMIKFGTQHPITLTTYSRLAAAYFAAGKYIESEKYNRLAWKGRIVALGPENVLVFQSQVDLARALQALCSHQEAYDQYTIALTGLETHYAKDSPELVWCVDGLAYTSQMIGELDLSALYYERLLHYYQYLHGTEHLITLDTINKLATVYKDSHRMEDAELLSNSALQGCIRTLGNDHPTTQASVAIVAFLKHSKGEAAEAAEMYRLALECNERIFGHDHVNTATTASNIGILLEEAQSFSAAELQHRRALASFEKVCGTDHPLTLAEVHYVGVLLSRQEELKEAEEFLRRAFSGREKCFGLNNEATLTSMHMLARVLDAESTWMHAPETAARVAEAQALYNQCMTYRISLLGRDHADTLDTMSCYAEYLGLHGQQMRAQELYRTLLRVCRADKGLTDIKTAESAYRLGEIMQAQCNHEDAAELFLFAFIGYSTAFIFQIQNSPHDPGSSHTSHDSHYALTASLCAVQDLLNHLPFEPPSTSGGVSDHLKQKPKPVLRSSMSLMAQYCSSKQLLSSCRSDTLDAALQSHGRDKAPSLSMEQVMRCRSPSPPGRAVRGSVSGNDFTSQQLEWHHMFVHAALDDKREVSLSLYPARHGTSHHAPPLLSQLSYGSSASPLSPSSPKRMSSRRPGYNRKSMTGSGAVSTSAAAAAAAGRSNLARAGKDTMAGGASSGGGGYTSLNSSMSMSIGADHTGNFIAQRNSIHSPQSKNRVSFSKSISIQNDHSEFPKYNPTNYGVSNNATTGAVTRDDYMTNSLNVAWTHWLNKLNLSDFDDVSRDVLEDAKMVYLNAVHRALS